MKKNIFLNVLLISATIIGLASCSKSSSGGGTNANIQQTQTAVMNDFVNVLLQPSYDTLLAKATRLNKSVQTLVATPTTANQLAAQQAWVDIRVTWEQTEGFLFGPIEDDNYDPNTDTWPTDRNEIDSLLNSNSGITNNFLNNQNDAVKGYHPLEYFLWDTSINYSAPEKNYVTALSGNILDNETALQSSWTTGGYSSIYLNPGSGNASYPTQEKAIESIAQGLIDICNEVAENTPDGKMYEPFTTRDSTITESPYSHNSVADFKNNIQGALNSYTCTFNGKTGTSLSNLVQINNRNLDNQIKTAFNNAINSFNAFGTAGVTFEQAIYTQRPIIQNTITLINTLQTLLSDQLIAYVRQYIKN